MESADSADINSEAIFEEIQLKKVVDKFGNIRYYDKDNKLHRVGGPAYIGNNRNLVWYHHGICHRLNGPAITSNTGYIAYYQNGRRYRLDGPAVTRPNGDIEFWINNKWVTENRYWEIVREIKNGV